MSRPPDHRPPSAVHEDLVLHALGAMPPEAATEIEAALAADARLREAHDRISAHLLRYEVLSAPPAQPALETVLAGLGPQRGARHAGLPRDVGRPWLALRLVSAAALLLLALGTVWLARPDADTPAPRGAAAGWELLAGEASARGADLLAVGLVRARWSERVEVALAPDSVLEGVSEQEVRLARGVAWFDVQPGPFRVQTPYGEVVVRGTRFEVDIQGAGLRVGVEEGRVEVTEVRAAASHSVSAGQELLRGTVVAAQHRPGAWREQLRLELSHAQSHADGQHTLQLTFVNSGWVPLALETSGSATERSLLIRLEGPSGQVLDLPLDLDALTLQPLRPEAEPDAAPGTGQVPEAPGAGRILAPGAKLGCALRIAAPQGPPGTYRCTAFYRQPSRPPVVSGPLQLEVR